MRQVRVKKLRNFALSTYGFVKKTGITFKSYFRRVKKEFVRGNYV